MAKKQPWHPGGTVILHTECSNSKRLAGRLKGCLQSFRNHQDVYVADFSECDESRWTEIEELGSSGVLICLWHSAGTTLSISGPKLKRLKRLSEMGSTNQLHFVNKFSSSNYCDTIISSLSTFEPKSMTVVLKTYESEAMLNDAAVAHTSQVITRGGDSSIDDNLSSLRRSFEASFRTCDRIGLLRDLGDLTKGCGFDIRELEVRSWGPLCLGFFSGFFSETLNAREVVDFQKKVKELFPPYPGFSAPFTSPVVTHLEGDSYKREVTRRLQICTIEGQDLPSEPGLLADIIASSSYLGRGIYAARIFSTTMGSTGQMTGEGIRNSLEFNIGVTPLLADDIRSACEVISKRLRNRNRDSKIRIRYQEDTERLRENGEASYLTELKSWL